MVVHAAAGGVGRLLSQWATHLGAMVLGTVGTFEKVKVAAEAGCAHVIVLREQDFEAEIKRITNGRGVDVVYDSIGADTFEKSLNVLRPLGMMVSLALARRAALCHRWTSANSPRRAPCSWPNQLSQLSHPRGKA
jgi:NADPH:quinone reductase